MGICGYEAQIEISKKRADNPFYRQYIKCKNHYTIDEDAIYYWINANGDQIGGQTRWVGWFDKEERKERRVLREVNPEKAIKLCTDVCGKPMVLECQEDVHAFMVYGGQAIIKKDICEKYMPWYLKEFIVDSEELYNDLF